MKLSRFNDNFFHTGHYWLLSGQPDRLRAVIEGTGFARSDEDARWALPDMKGLFGVALSRADVVEGYDWGRSRNSWYSIFVGELTALYEHN